MLTANLSAMDTRWRIQLFGSLRAERGDHVVTHFRTQKAASLLAYLAFYHQRTHPREVLIELLWPDCDVDVGRQRLSGALSVLRRPLEPAGVSGVAVFTADHFSVGLNPVAVTTDVAEFEAALQSALATNDTVERTERLARAVELYRGELLPGYYEPWVLSEQQRIEELYFQSLRQLLALLVQARDLDRALPYALRAVRIDPLREETHRELMRLYVAAGQPAVALRQYGDLQRILQQELDETPSAETRALAEEIGRSATEGEKGSRGERESRQGRGGLLPVSPSPLLPFSPSVAERPAPSLEPAGGAVRLDSAFYLERAIDADLRAAIDRRDGIILIKGASQVGKTSLLARGLQYARQTGARGVVTDLQKLNAPDMQTAEAFCLRLAGWIAEQLDLDVLPSPHLEGGNPSPSLQAGTPVWHARRGPSANLERYVRRHVLVAVQEPVFWALDEVDRLFERPFSSEIFRLFRSWHNERALDPSGPWSRLTLAIAYATEVHLFLTDLNQSPFNVGTPLALDDFSREQVADLNRRYGAPLNDEAEEARFHRLLSGHPHLVRLGLHEMAAHGTGIAELESRAASDDWIFGGHLQRLAAQLTRDADLCEVVRGVLRGRPCPTPESFYHLRSAGVLAGDSPRRASPRCQLYATYLKRHLL